MTEKASWRSLLGCQLQGQPVSSLLSNVFHKNKSLIGNATQLSVISLIEEGSFVVLCFHLVISRNQESEFSSIQLKSSGFL